MVASGQRPAWRPVARLAASLMGLLVLSLMSVLSLAAALLAASGGQPEQGDTGGVTPPAVAVSPTPSPPAAATPSPSPMVLDTATPTPSPPPTATVTSTATPTATPATALVSTSAGLGAVLRAAPAGPIISTVFEGAQVQILAGPEVVEGRAWWLVRSEAGVEGWILGRLVVTATPPATP